MITLLFESGEDKIREHMESAGLIDKALLTVIIAFLITST